MPVRDVPVRDITYHVREEGEGPVVLLVHGFPLNHTMWLPQIEALAGTRRVIAPDLRGFGQSGVTEGTVTMQDFADDLASLLDALSVSEPVCFIGLSMGGYIAWPFLERYGQRVGKLVLMDTRAVADTPEAAEGRYKMADYMLKSGMSVVAKAMLPRLLAPSTKHSQPHLVERLEEMILSNDPRGAAAAQRGMAERPNREEFLAGIDVPTLLVVGENDAISTAEEMANMAEAISGSRLEVIPDAGHMSNLEAADQVNAVLREFLS